MRVALYARVSTGDQTVDPQLDALRSYATARRLEIVEEYIDQGVSGSKDRRPALDDLMVPAKCRAFDALAIVKLDRLARSVRHLTQIGAELEALGIDLIVVDQGIDTSTPSGRLLFNVLGSIAEFERDLIRERTRAGLKAARKRGGTDWTAQGFDRCRSCPCEASCCGREVTPRDRGGGRRWEGDGAAGAGLDGPKPL